MTKKIESQVVLASLVLFASSVSFAQSSGEAVYKANCQSCHGSNGTPSAGMAKMMGVKAVSDPDVKNMTVAQDFDAVKNGKAKMKPFAGKLTDDQIKDVVTYFRSLK